FIDARQLGFTDPASAWAWRFIASLDRPTILAVKTEARRIDPADPAYAGVQAILSAPDIRENEYVTGQIIEWARRQLFAVGFEEARQSWNAGQFDTAMTAMMRRIEEIQNIALGNADRGWFF